MLRRNLITRAVRGSCPGRVSRLSLVMLGFLLVACAPPATPSSAPQSQPQASAPAGAQPKTLTVAVQGEPVNLMTIMGGDIGGSPAQRVEDAVHQHLMVYDHRGEVRPMLLAELPSQAKGTWVVRADGTMQTTYQLRPGVTWHDGTPFTAKDVVFGWTVTMDTELPIDTRTVASLISRVEATDDLTVVAEWSKISPYADQIVDWDLGPLPSHLLESTYQSDKDRFQRLPYWNREFVGLGPYSVSNWELGSHITATAYDRFYAGRPKIDTLVVKFIPNEPTVVANLLSGAVDGQFRAISFNQVMFVKEEWERSGKQPVAIGQPTTWRLMDVQFRDQARDASLRDLADTRVRRALLHAIDRVAMVGHLYQGQAHVGDTFVPPDSARWDTVKDAIVKYDYDPRRAQQLLEEMGWRRGADGTYLNSEGGRINLSLWTTEGGQWQEEMAIAADNWKAIGLPTEQYVIPTAQSRDRRLRTTFPGLSSTSAQFGLFNVVRTFLSSECPIEASRYVGSNRGCYHNASTDRLVESLVSTVDPNEQRRLARDLVRATTEDVAVLPLYYTVQMIFFREGVTGVLGGSRPTGGDTWNIYEWDLR